MLATTLRVTVTPTNNGVCHLTFPGGAHGTACPHGDTVEVTSGHRTWHGKSQGLALDRAMAAMWGRKDDPDGPVPVYWIERYPRTPRVTTPTKGQDL